MRYGVHRAPGNCFQEAIYQRALAIGMAAQGLELIREQEMSVCYKGVDIGTRRVDFFVEGVVMVELKALVALEDEESRLHRRLSTNRDSSLRSE